MRLLIVHPGGIGDVLLAVPSMRGLLRRHNVMGVGLVASRQVGQLLWQCHEVEQVFTLESAELANLVSGCDPSRSPIRSWLRDCERAVCWMSDRDGRLAAALGSLGVRQRDIVSVMTGSFQSHHQSDRFAEACGLPGLEPEDFRPLKLADQLREAGREWLGKIGVLGDRAYVVVHPGSGGLHKCCRPAILASTLQWLEQNGLFPLIIEGPADEVQVRRLQAFVPRPLQILKGGDLSVVASIIQAASLYIGHDSGITHLAAALGVPTIACFGPTDETRWGPRGSTVRVVRGASCCCSSLVQMKQCIEKPCLNIDSATLTSACDKLLNGSLQQL